MDIQQQEQEIRDKEHTRVEGKWYIDQRVRAGSISAIQEAEERNREHELLVEEQRQIEAQIQRERQEQQEQQNKKKRSRNRKPQKANQKNEGDCGNGKNQQKAAKSGGRNKRPNRRKMSNASSEKQATKNVVQSN